MSKKIVTTKLESIKTVNIETIQPFTEKPSVDKELKDPAASGKGIGNDDDRRIGASDLFSMFTADIIKQRVTFTR